MLIPKMITEDHIDLMHIIEQDPSTSQRDSSKCWLKYRKGKLLYQNLNKHWIYEIS